MATLEENKKYWEDLNNWEGKGEEWSNAFGGSEMQFYFFLLPRLHSILPVNCILEIAPGFGRWTKYLKIYCKKIIGIDISHECVEHCKGLFPQHTFYENDGSNLSVVEDNCVDLIFSFDSLVHVDADTLGKYLSQFSRILTKDGCAFLHHSNALDCNYKGVPPHWRDGSVGHNFVKEVCDETGLKCISQELITWGEGAHNDKKLLDCISLITPLGSNFLSDYKVVENYSQEIINAEIKKLSILYKIPKDKGD